MPKKIQALKFDGDKPRTDLVPISLIMGCARGLAHGARKYMANNWLLGFSFNRPYGALLRHLFAWWSGEDLDPDSGLPHLDHAICNLAFLKEYTDKKKRYKRFDNRPFKITDRDLKKELEDFKGI